MGKRKLVPAALHAELSQYSSLLRALRTSNTLDVTAQLTQHQESLKGKERAIESDSEDGLDDIDVDDELNEYNRYDNTLLEDAAHSDFRPWSPPPPLSSLSPGRKRKRTVEPSPQASSPFNTPEPSARDGVNERTQINRSSRDNWTRWPLLVNDVPIPEWSLQDEIAHIVSFLQRHSHSHSQSLSNNLPPDPDPEEFIPPSSSISAESGRSDHHSDVAVDPPPFLPSLTLTANHLLQRTFAALAFLTPPRPPSMQNRLDPIGWETVLEAFALASLQAPGNPHDLEATQRIIEKVHQRMEVIYGPSQPKVRKHLRPTLDNETSSPVRVISTPAERTNTTATTDNAEGSLSTLDASIDIPTQPPSTPRRAGTVPPPQNSSLLLPAAPDASVIAHRLQIIAESRKQLAGSLSKLGASTSSLFDVPALEMSNTKARLSRPRARKSVPPKRGPQVLVASSSITSHSPRRRSSKTNLKKQREGNEEDEEDDVVAEQEPMDSVEEDEHSSQGSEEDIENLDGEEQPDDQEKRSTSRRKYKRKHKYAKKSKEDGTGDMEDATPRGDDEEDGSTTLHTRIKKPPAEDIASSSATKRSTRASKTLQAKAPTTSSASKKRGKSSTKYKSAEFIEDSDVD